VNRLKDDRFTAFTPFTAGPKPARKVLEAWEYRDPAEVMERREDQQEGRERAAAARIEAAAIAEQARAAEVTPLSPVTQRLIKRLRIRALLNKVMGNGGVK